MKILIINPNSDENTNKILREKVGRMSFPDVDVDVTSISYMPKLVSCYRDVAKSAPGMIELVENDTVYDGYIVGCHLDPNLEVLREITEKPVIGIGEASLRVASMMCSRFAVVSPSKNSERRKVKMIHNCFCDEQYTGTVVPECFSEQSIVDAAGQAVEKWNVDGIVLGCANYALFDNLIEKKYGVKCFDGAACALLLAVGMSIYQKQKEQS